MTKSRGIAAPPWSEEEDEILKRSWYMMAAELLAALPGRTWTAISNRTAKLMGREYWTVQRIAQALGHDRKVILGRIEEMEAEGHKFARSALSTKRDYRITDEEYQEIAARMQKWAARWWSRDYDVCQICGKNDREHIGKGVCGRCHWQRMNPRLSQERVWSAHGDKCLRCGRSDKPHKGKGYCSTCYYQIRNSSEE